MWECVNRVWWKAFDCEGPNLPILIYGVRSKKRLLARGPSPGLSPHPIGWVHESWFRCHCAGLGPGPTAWVQLRGYGTLSRSGLRVQLRGFSSGFKFQMRRFWHCAPVPIARRPALESEIVLCEHGSGSESNCADWALGWSPIVRVAALTSGPVARVRDWSGSILRGSGTRSQSNEAGPGLISSPIRLDSQLVRVQLRGLGTGFQSNSARAAVSPGWIARMRRGLDSIARVRRKVWVELRLSRTGRESNCAGPALGPVSIARRRHWVRVQLDKSGTGSRSNCPGRSSGCGAEKVHFYRIRVQLLKKSFLVASEGLKSHFKVRLFKEKKWIYNWYEYHFDFISNRKSLQSSFRLLNWIHRQDWRGYINSYNFISNKTTKALENDWTRKTIKQEEEEIWIFFL